MKNEISELVEDATLEFTLGNNDLAIEKLTEAIQAEANCFEAWHALTEVYFSQKDFDKSLVSAKKAYDLKPDDIHINTSLSRIWMEKGDKETAEKFGAEARRLSWKDELKNNPSDSI